MNALNTDLILSKQLSVLENKLYGLAVPSDQARTPTGDIIPGDVELISITLFSLDQTKQFDLMGMAKVVNLYEDLFTPTIIAEFQIQDLIDLQNTFNIKPADYIQLSFKTPKTSTVVELLFGVQSINNVEVKENLKLKTYTITAVTPEALRNSNMSIQFKQKDSASKLVKRVFDDHIKTNKDVYIDNSKLIEDFPPISSIRPFQAINYLIKFSYSSQFNSNAFVFFENKRGFFFTTIERLIAEGVKAQGKGNQFTDKEFFYDIASNEDTRNMSFRNILSYKRLNSNTFETASKVSTIIATYDFCRGEYIKTIKLLGDESFELLEGQSSSIDPTFDALYGKETCNIDFIPITTDTMPKEFGSLVANRQMFANKLDQDSIELLVYGDTELAVGDVIRCNFPNISARAKDQTTAEIETGNYLIVSLRHILLNSDRPQHLISMRCTRDRNI